jgi:hypothetical protein
LFNEEAPAFDIVEMGSVISFGNKYKIERKARRGHGRRQSFAGLRHIPKGGSLLSLHQSRMLRKRAEVESQNRPVPPV